MNRIIFFFALISVITTNGVIAQTYCEDDKEGLRMFLRQFSADDGRINAERLGLQISDTLDWQDSEAWIAKIHAILVWNDESPKRLVEMNVAIVTLSLHAETIGVNIILTGVLDASKWSELTSLYCENNRLSALDVSTNMALTTLSCYRNQLTTLDVSANTALTNLSCSDNYLTSLDVSSNQALKQLVCSMNKIVALDVSANTSLQTLYCDNNELTILDVSANKALRYINCQYNQLSALVTNEENEFIFVECHDNRLPLSEIYKVFKLLIYEGSVMFGTQYFLPLTVTTGSEIDYSNQNIIGGIYTEFSITKSGSPASQSDYSLVEGKITFNSNGKYTVTMTNEAIDPNPFDPVQVVVEVEVGNVGNEQVIWDATKMIVYPNPTSDELRITNYQLYTNDYSIYSVSGQLVKQGKLQGETTTIYVGSLATGVYYLKISGGVVKFVKQ